MKDRPDINEFWTRKKDGEKVKILWIKPDRNEVYFTSSRRGFWSNIDTFMKKYYNSNGNTEK